MPTVRVPSASVRIHSWLAVYLKSAGTFMSESPVVSFNEYLAVTNERRLDDARGELFVADVDAHALARGDTHRQSRERDRCAERRRKGAAGDFAVAAVAAHMLVAAEHPSFVDKQQANLLLLRQPCGKRVFADEIARARTIDSPRQAGFQRVHAFVHVLAVEIHAGFEAQRVAGAQSAGTYAHGDERAPEFARTRSGKDDLETVFAGVAGARDEVVAELGRHERLQLLRRRAAAGHGVPNALTRA